MKLLLQGLLLSTLTVSVAMANDNFSTPRKQSAVNTTSETVKVEATTTSKAATAKPKAATHVNAELPANFAVRKLMF